MSESFEICAQKNHLNLKNSDQTSKNVLLILTLSQSIYTVKKIKMFRPPNAVTSSFYAMNKRAPCAYPYVCGVRQYLLKGVQNHDIKLSYLLVEA